MIKLDSFFVQYKIYWSRYELKNIGLDYVSPNIFQLIARPINLCIGLNESNFISTSVKHRIGNIMSIDTGGWIGPISVKHR